MIKKFGWYLYKIVRRISWEIFRLFPIDKKKIVFCSYYGRGYSDNLKYICEVFADKKDFKLIWVIDKEEEADSLPEYVQSCKINTITMVYHYSTAGVWIDNCRKGFRYKKREQFYIQTWHGGGAQKKCEKDVEASLPEWYLQKAKKDAQYTDLMISESRFLTQLYHKSFWYDGLVYQCGYPRYDILLRENTDIKRKVCDYYGIDAQKLLVIYAPTFRADYSFDAYKIDFPRLQNNIVRRFGNDCVILVHLHPNVANKAENIHYDGEIVINSTFYPDTQELLAAASVLIGDYSSINYDFCLRKLPVFRFVTDIDEYKNDRDFFLDFSDYPYPYAQNNDELEEIILKFDEKKYQKELDTFLQRMGAVTEYGASQRVANIVVDYVNSKNKHEFFEKNKDMFC